MKVYLDRHPDHNWQSESDGCICEALYQASGRGWTYVVMDNFFPSPVWFDYLAFGKIKRFGTLHPICRGMPYEFGFKVLKVKLDNIQSDLGEI